MLEVFALTYKLKTKVRHIWIFERQLGNSADTLYFIVGSPTQTDRDIRSSPIHNFGSPKRKLFSTPKGSQQKKPNSGT